MQTSCSTFDVILEFITSRSVLFFNDLSQTRLSPAPAAPAATLFTLPSFWRQCQKNKADKSIKWAGEGLKTCVSLEGFPPPSSFSWLFTSRSPLCDLSLREKRSTSLDLANYRALTSAWLSPKCWRTFLQLGNSMCMFVFVWKSVCVSCPKHLFKNGANVHLHNAVVTTHSPLVPKPDTVFDFCLCWSFWIQI